MKPSPYDALMLVYAARDAALERAERDVMRQFAMRLADAHLIYKRHCEALGLPTIEDRT